MAWLWHECTEAQDLEGRLLGSNNERPRFDSAPQTPYPTCEGAVLLPSQSGKSSPQLVFQVVLLIFL